MRKGVKTILLILAGLLILTGLGMILTDFTQRLELQATAVKLGWWGPVFLTLGIAIGGIIVPLTSLPFLIAGLTLYGLWPTFFMYYIGNTVIAPYVDFVIARKFGRPAVRKLAGEKSLKQIDKISHVVGYRVLSILRFSGGILHDSVSYAVGLTDFDIRKYMFLTLTLPIPGMILTLYFIGKGLTQSPLFFAVIVVWGYGAGLLTSYIILREHRALKLKHVKKN